MRERPPGPACAVCGYTGYWVGYSLDHGQYRCLNHNTDSIEPEPTVDEIALEMFNDGPSWSRRKKRS